MGPDASAAIPALTQALLDPEPSVRAPAADALGHIGPAAKTAAGALGGKLLTAGEPAYVLRSVATALGDIGPDAAAALPALHEALKLHRVTASAEEAILRIQGKPVPTWF
jgi:HEAT repeat protein